MAGDTMELRLESAPDAWVGNTAFLGREVTVRLKSPALRPSKSRDEVADEGVREALDRWDAVQQVLSTETYDNYARNWLPEGGSAMPPSEFLTSIRLTGINIDVEDADTMSLFLYFDAGGLFGGHGIEVFIDGASGDIDADIVG